jgi:ubiquinone/menaquinone biosynthesis C-methylase UbiE
MTTGPEIQAMIDRDFPPDSHPYRILERAILNHLDPGCTVLDIGCGRRAPNLRQLKGRARTLIGIDLVDFELEDAELLLVNADVCDMAAVPSGSVDLSYSRSVMEHIKNVRAAYSEINRV